MEFNACEEKVEMEVDIQGRKSYYDILKDMDIPLHGLSYRGVTGFILHVNLNKLRNELILEVIYFFESQLLTWISTYREKKYPQKRPERSSLF